MKAWTDEGVTVKIFTARARAPDQVPFISEWLEKHGIGGLEITNIKDFGMVELWDDRSVRVISNKGVPCCEQRHTI